VAGAWRWQLESSQVETLVNTSLDLGITSFDHADIYGEYSNEKIFGEVLKKNPSLREDMELITKCGIQLTSEKMPQNWVKHYDTSSNHIQQQVEKSLQNLNTDRIDLLLIHRPDPLLNPIDVAEAFAKLKEAGKVLHFGVSNFTPHQFDMLQAYLPFPLMTNQIELSLFHNEPLTSGVLDHLIQNKVKPMAWSPLGGGVHFGSESDLTEELALGFEKLSAKHDDATTAQLLIAWLLYHPAAVVPVIGTTKPPRIKEAAESVSIELDRQDWFEMWRLVRGRDID
jgi:predicted oxidoreductase